MILIMNILKVGDDKLKSDLFDVVRNHGEMFQEPKGLPLERGIQHEIQLQ